MTKQSDAWMPLYVGDYLRDTGDLTTIEHGAYLLLIMQAWIRNGLLPGNDEKLRTMTGMSTRQWNHSRETILSLFVWTPDGYRHKRVDKELARVGALREQRRGAGLASAAARRVEPVFNENPTARQHMLPMYSDTSMAYGESSVIENSEDELPNFAESGNAAPQSTDTNCQTQLIDIIQNHANERCNGEATGDQRKSNYPQPYSKKEVPSLRSGCEPQPVDAKTLLWKEGLASLMNLTTKARKDAGKMLGKLSDFAGGDHAMLLGLIRDAEIAQPDQPYPWLIAAISARKSCGTLFGPSETQNDPWGLGEWISKQPDTEIGSTGGRSCKVLNGWSIEHYAEKIADAAGLPRQCRINWDCLGVWLREDMGMIDEKPVLDAVRSQASRMSGTISSMKVFDSTVRGAAARIKGTR